MLVAFEVHWGLYLPFCILPYSFGVYIGFLIFQDGRFFVWFVLFSTGIWLLVGGIYFMVLVCGSVKDWLCQYF